MASVRGDLRSYDECDRLFAELEGRLPPGVAPEERAAVWHHGRGTIDCEALVFLAGPRPRIDGVHVYEMPAHTAACLVYRGDETFPSAYAALQAWLAATGVTITGAKREVYLDEGGAHGESVTEIQYPIAFSPEASDPKEWA